MIHRPASKFVRDVNHTPIVPSDRVIRSVELAHIGNQNVAERHTPTVELITDDNIVRAIDITCQCGTKMRVWCSYEQPTESAQSTDPIQELDP
jgi:hypothetical protein